MDDHQSSYKRSEQPNLPRLPTSAVPSIQPSLPSAPPGRITFVDLRFQILVAAFGDNVYRDAFAADRNLTRMRRALEAYKAAAGLRLGRHPTALGGYLHWSPWDPPHPPPTPLGLLGRLSLQPPLPLSLEEERAKAKAIRAERRLNDLESLATTSRDRLLWAFERVNAFIRSLGVQGDLCAITVDRAGAETKVRALAWRDAENWERLKRERIFRPADENFSGPGMPCFPLATAKALLEFVSQRGEAGLDDIAGALRALGRFDLRLEPQWQSAMDWFRTEGEAEVRASMEVNGVRKSAGAIRREARDRWNALPAEMKGPNAKHVVTEQAFKHAKRRALTRKKAPDAGRK